MKPVKTTEIMMERFLTGATTFEKAGFAATEDAHKFHLWEKATLAGMCAYLLKALHDANPGEATIACSFIIDADENGEHLSEWVQEQLAKSDGPEQTDEPKAHAYSSHGWPCCDDAPAEQPRLVAKCGGPGLCTLCKVWANQVHLGFPMVRDGDDGPASSVSAQAQEQPCCDLHNRNCEPPSELCCGQCTEASHCTFPVPHADGTKCVWAVSAQAEAGGNG